MKLEEEIHQKAFASEYQKMVINILYTSGWLSSIQNQLFKPHGISMQQYNVLRILKGQRPNPATINIIQERMIDKTSNASRLVDKLVARKLVARKPCESDRRQVDVCITDAGLKFLKKLEPDVRSMEHTLGGLTEKEVRQLNELLDNLRTNSLLNS